MRNRERTWRKYRLQSNWIAFKVERNKYRAMLKAIRKTTLSEKINEGKQDTKKLYAFVNNIIGRASENLLPKIESDEQLTGEFADHFMAKIKKIQDALENHPIYKPEHRDTDQLKEFQLLSENEVKKIIGKMSSKSCKIDPMPTTLLRKVLPSLIRPITSIVNSSITKGIFAMTWKTAIICPLLKKSGLALQLNNFRPVSNLSFLS